MRAIEFKATREGLGLSVKKFSKMSGLAETSIKKFENGQFAVPRGMYAVFEKVRAKVYAPARRWAALTVEEFASARGAWATRSRGWSAYRTQDDAEEAAELFPELWAVPVKVRKLLGKTPMRELWEELYVTENAQLEEKSE